MLSGQPDVAAGSYELRDRAEGDFKPDFVYQVGDGTLQQRNLEIVAMAAKIQLLSQPNRPERIYAGYGRLTVAKQCQAGAAAADLGEQRRLPDECVVSLEG